jgi:outer membrane receptor protein involved in Fe transport
MPTTPGGPCSSETERASGTFYFDTEILRAVEVTRGPFTGPDGGAIGGGTVSFITLDAADVLVDDERTALRLKATGETKAPSFLGHGEAASSPTASTWSLPGHGGMPATTRTAAARPSTRRRTCSRASPKQSDVILTPST